MMIGVSCKFNNLFWSEETCTPASVSICWCEANELMYLHMNEQHIPYGVTLGRLSSICILGLKLFAVVCPKNQILKNFW